MANSRTNRVAKATHSEEDLFKGLIKKLGDLAKGHSQTVDGLKATNNNVSELRTEVDELKKRPSVTPAEIESMLGDLDKIEVNNLK